ncbi:hypothetical protein ENKNEFLB_01407 [Nocardioides aquaticus]|uniref:Uncharacterized protein n=1 Tax=Nocardioides aquaticus TaxID=160826 RepID=A0ABX8EG14_9ACTN|nr:hypothetical protein [Nocardioides aquaticus]QVT79027.1 hypothetical protein ENKNEFLB_01407 [Nocardioides aquaticus]
MRAMNLPTTDPAALEAEMEAQPAGTLARVVTADGEPLTVRRVPGGWYLPGDLVVASGDVAGALPREVSVLLDQDQPSDEGLAILADLDPEGARDVATWAEAQHSARLSGKSGDR